MKRAEPTARTSGSRILVVDDDHGLRELIMRTLARIGHVVRGAADGNEALQRITEDPPQVLLLDDRLPDMTGREMVTALANRGMKIPFVMMTGQGDERLAVEVMKLGAADYLVKDTELIDRLPLVIERVLNAVAMEGALRERQARLDAITDSARDAIIMMAPDGVISFWNPAAERIFGYGSDEAVGKDLHLLLSSEPLSAHWTAFDAFPTSGRGTALNKTVELPSRRKDGAEISIELSLTALRQPDGWHALGIVRDITERKRFEEEREALRKTAEALAGVFLGLGPEPKQNMDRIVRAARELTGSAAALYNRLDDAGCSIEVWSGQQLPPDMPRADASWGCICHDVTIRGQERTIILGNLENTDHKHTAAALGRYGLKAYLGHPVQLRGVAIGALAVVDGKPRAFTSGEVGAIQMLAKALSLEEERHLVERELKQSEERFRGMLQNVATVAVQGYALDGTVRYWNHASESFYGYTAEEALGRNLLDLIIPPAMRDEVSAAIQHMAKTGDIIPPSELVLMRKDGSLIPVYSSHAFVNVPGKEPELFCIDVDLSARQQADAEKEKLQAQLAQAQKMESVGRLAGGVAHDFNNMLGAILGYTELCLNKTTPSHPLHGHLRQIRKAAERSAELTRQLLAFARKQPVVPKVLDLNETVEGMLKILRRLIGENIDLAWLPGGNLDPILIDPSQVDQILANLCVNARDAIAGTGKVVIETAHASFDEAFCAAYAGFVPGEYVLLAVSDDGCGMDAETQAKIFEPFFTTKEMGKGTGLGLATVYGIVKQNNGFINVYSEPGHGTTFRIYLPRTEHRAERARKVEAPESVVRGSETILLVEDEPMLLMLGREMLETLGYRVLAASTPGEAIRLAEVHSGAVHLVVTDVVMPEMNGGDLARNLVASYPDLKMLFMSGYAADVIAHHGMLDPEVYFIQKPFSRKQLSIKVRKALDRQ